jgi:hypothetical protein
MPGSTTRKQRHVFKIVIDGVALPKQLANRIDEALQKAVLNEIVAFDLNDQELVLSPIMSKMAEEDEASLGGVGRTGGRYIKIISQT